MHDSEFGRVLCQGVKRGSFWSGCQRWKLVVHTNPPNFAVKVQGHVVHNIGAEEAWNLLGGALRIAFGAGFEDRRNLHGGD